MSPGKLPNPAKHITVESKVKERNTVNCVDVYEFQELVSDHSIKEEP